MRCSVSLLMLATSVQGKAPPAKPTWPSTFFVNFEEFFAGGDGQSYHGAFVLDMDFVDKATGIKGAEAVDRGPSKDSTCEAINPGQSCITVSVGGQRYLNFDDGSPICCRCCSWANGCGPLVPRWTDNATFIGSKTVRGELCYSYLIPGNQNNSLSVRASDGMICDLDNAGEDFFEFLPKSYSPTISPAAARLLSVPGGCDTWCGAHGECALG
jgi:hypothetical protein